MSTKSSIYYTQNGTHIYSETSEFNEQCNAFNIYWDAFWAEYEDVSVDSAGDICIRFKNGIAKTISIRDVIKASFDFEGFSICIKPNSQAAHIIKQMANK